MVLVQPMLDIRPEGFGPDQFLFQVNFSARYSGHDGADGQVHLVRDFLIGQPFEIEQNDGLFQTVVQAVQQLPHVLFDFGLDEIVFNMSDVLQAVAEQIELKIYPPLVFFDLLQEQIPEDGEQPIFTFRPVF